MAKTNVFIPKNSTTISLSNEEFDVKFNKSVEQLNAGLTKGQKALKLFYDENQRLTDSLGRCVEGLSLSQIRLGMWTDELGRARTINGGYVEGLSKAELELGYYADELGKVYDRQGEEIRQTQKYINSLKDEENALHQTREAFADAFDAIGDGAGRFASLLGSLDGLTAGAEEFRQALIAATGAADVFSQTLSAFKNIQVGIQKARNAAIAFDAAMKTSTTTATGLKAAVAALGGPWTLVAAGIASAVAAITLFNNETESASKKSVEAADKISESFEKVKERAKEAGAEIRGLNDVLKYGAFFQGGDGNSLKSLEAQIKAQQEEVAKAQAERDRAQEAARNVTASGPSAGTAQSYAWKEFDKANRAFSAEQEKLESLQAQYNDVATGLIAKLREENTTEEQKAEALKKQYQTLLERAQTDDDRAMIEAKIKSIDAGIADAKAKELEAQRDALAKDLGISFDFAPIKTQEEKLAADLEKLRDAFKADPDMFGGVEGALEEAEERIRQKFVQQFEKDLGISLDFAPVKSQVDAMADDLAKLSEAFHADPDMFGGVEGALEEAENRIRQKYSDQNLKTFSDALGSVETEESLRALQTDLADKLAKGLLTQDAYDKAQEDATKKLGELTDARIAAIPGLKELLEANDDESADAKSEADRQYAETMEALDKALQERLVTDEKYAELARKADERLAKAKEDEAAKLRADARSKLGIDAIMEELKTPAQKFADKMKEAQAALDANQINKEEFDAYRDKIQKEIYGERKELETFAKKFEEPKAAKPEKEAGPAKSMEAGSADLYLAQVRNSTAQYQKQIQSTTAGIYDAQLGALDESRMTNYYLAEILENGGNLNLPVWG